MPNLADVRAEEFDCVRHYFRAGMRVLEIGGGTGYQASLIAGTGASVDSVDVAAPLPRVETYFPGRICDGRILPFPDNHFDVVLSSNVLEHIADLSTSLNDVRRVMKPYGLAIHILPTPAWRTCTSLSHYIHIARRLIGLVGGGRQPRELSQVWVSNPARTRSIWGAVKHVLWDGPHGEYPSAISELWYFSGRRWLKLFQKRGFEVTDQRPSGILYTGYGVLPMISMEKRRRLARVLGSATRVFVMRKTP